MMGVLATWWYETDLGMNCRRMTTMTINLTWGVESSGRRTMADMI